MKAILMSIKPQHICNILNDIKLLEIRKKFPKDYIGWVYIYCTKNTSLGWVNEWLRKNKKELPAIHIGKVVARFWCDKVEEIKFYDKDIQRQACLTEDELFDYLFINELYHEDMHKGYGISITKLEIFNKPKEISEFKHICPNVMCDSCKYGDKEIDRALPICKRQLTRAPQSWCYIEI